MHASVLKYIVEVARHGSVRKAGTALNVASSGINQRILSLENELGVQLFVRSPNGMEPTTAGRLLLAHAERTLNEFNTLRPLITDVRDLKAGHVRIACEASIHERVFADIFESFIRAHPKVTLSVFQGGPEEVMQAMEDGHAEVGITFTHFARHNARKASDYPAPFGAIVPAGHPLAARTTVTLAECLESPIVRYCPPGGRDVLLDEQLERQGKTARLFAYTNSLRFAKTVILSGRAIAISSCYGFIDELEQARAAFVPISHSSLSAHRLGVFIPTSRHLDAIERRLIEVVSSVLDGYAGKAWNRPIAAGVPLQPGEADISGI